MSILDSGSSILSGVTGIASKIGGSLAGILDPGVARLSTANLAPGGGRNGPPPTETRYNVVSTTGAVSIENDWRVRVSVGDTSNIFYQDSSAGVLAPLKNTKGVIFPYTPTITMAYTANYSSSKTTHSNYPAYFYDNSEVQAINVSCDFTVQNITEGQYLLACIYFFRSATKMFYGTGNLAGNPPPVLFLDGYGSHYLPHVPCILTSFQHTMGAEVDYLEIPTATGSTRLPTTSQIQISLQPVYSRKSIAGFDLKAFARGELVKGKGGFV